MVEFGDDVRRDDEQVTGSLDRPRHRLMVWLSGIEVREQALVSISTLTEAAQELVGPPDDVLRTGVDTAARAASHTSQGGANGFPDYLRLGDSALLGGQLDRCFQVVRQVDRRLLHGHMVLPVVPSFGFASAA